MHAIHACAIPHVLSKSTDVLPKSTTSPISYFRKVRPRPNGPFVSINTTTFDLSTLPNSHHPLTYGRRYQFLHLHLSPTHKTTHPSSSTHPYPHLHCHTRQWRSTRSLLMATKTMQVHLLLSGRQIAKTSSTRLGVASMRKGEPSIRCIATQSESPTSAMAASKLLVFLDALPQFLLVLFDRVLHSF